MLRGGDLTVLMREVGLCGASAGMVRLFLRARSTATKPNGSESVTLEGGVPRWYACLAGVAERCA